MRRRAALGAVVGTTMVLFGACAGPGEKDPPPVLLRGTEDRVLVIAGLESSPRPLAEAHCARYDRRAVFRDTEPAGDNLVRGWATGKKAFIYTFDCQ